MCCLTIEFMKLWRSVVSRQVAVLQGKKHQSFTAPVSRVLIPKYNHFVAGIPGFRGVGCIQGEVLGCR